MTTRTTISISEARKQFFSIAEQVQRPNVYYTLTDKGRPKAVVMSAEEFESWVETVEVMRDFPDLKLTIAETRRDIKQKKHKQYKTLNQVLQHDLPSTLKTKRRKRTA